MRELMPGLVNRYQVDLVVANGENASGGIGLAVKGAEELFASGVPGPYFRKSYLEEKRDLSLYPGKSGFDPAVATIRREPPVTVRSSRKPASGVPVAILNLMGRTFMEAVDCPFRNGDQGTGPLADHYSPYPG